jgi:phospholipid-binding lipoprotein MlaA
MTGLTRCFPSTLALLAAGMLAGCASMPPSTTGQVYDPYEATNRKVLSSNSSILRPVATVIRTVIPGPVRDHLGNMDANLKEPRIFANDILQLRFKAASTTFGRFLINSTLGVGGLFDIASQGGLAKQSGDFGQTLYRYGIGDGPYLVLPIIGPTNFRDTIGYAVDEIADPTTWAIDSQVGNIADLSIGGLDFITQIDQFKQAEDSSVDFYTFLRSSYYQHRQGELREAVGLPPISVVSVEAGSPAPVLVKPGKLHSCVPSKKHRCAKY